MHRSERGDDLVGERVFRHYEDVDIAAVLREIAGRERTVEIHADELRPERAAHARKQLREHRVDVGVAGRVTPRRSWLRGSDLNRRPLGYEPFPVGTAAYAPKTTRRKLAFLA